MNQLWGGTALAAGFVAGWNYIKSFASRILSLFVVSIDVHGGFQSALPAYCWKHFKRSPFGRRSYGSMTAFVRPSRRYQFIGYELLGRQSILFWVKWSPVLIGIVENKNGPSSVAINFIRGTFDADTFLGDVLDFYNEQRLNGTRKRYEVIRLSGQGSQLARNKPESLSSQPTSVCENSIDDITSGTCRLLKWDVSEVGVEHSDGKSALETLAFPKEIHSIVEEVNRWKLSETWYREKQIPWRRGWLLYGKPGTGKTSLVRAIAQDLDLPVCVFDLSTMSNDEMVNYWRKMLGQVPCICLMEDVDAVFSGRDNKLKEEGGGLTFDCLLNCISGIDSANGVFLVITTNRIDQLDEAIGVPRTDGHQKGTMISTRPGRIDRALELTTLDESCRFKLARRILADCPDNIAILVKQGEGDTGAQFQERCSQISLRHHWNESKTKL